MRKPQKDVPIFFEALNQMPIATAIYDNSNLNIAFANSRMLSMWRTENEIFGHSFAEVFPIFTQEGFTDILRNVWDSGVTYKAFDTPATITDRDFKFKRYFDFEYKPLFDKRGRTYSILHTATDVTHKIQEEKQKNQENTAINPATNLRMISYTLSHDAKNPLALAKLGIGVLKEHLDMQSNRRMELYDVIDQSLENIADIIDKTVELSLAPINKLQKQNIRLDLTLPNWCREAKLLYRSPHTELIFGDLFSVNSDQNGIYQIFTNLVNNAIKYSSANKNAQVHIYSEKVTNGVLYIIRDNGIGIPQHELENIRMERLRGSNSMDYQGKGIGLFIVQELLERLKAQMAIFSQENQGTEIRLFFPN
ncbi:ATP-binding protein [Sphingobacterium sp.]|uniref:sensor histidine kinase n=1 Tax=unclassified Sphingobacterium TaxID=2609468 RepID=UPI0028AD0173|nr:ATP-binding protein [Sphingobacterium sp.]